MKKGILLIVLAITTTFGFAQKQKLGHVASQGIMESLIEQDSVEFKVAQYQQKIERDLQVEQQMMLKAQQELMLIKDSISPEMFQRKYDNLVAEGQRFQQQVIPAQREKVNQFYQGLLIPLQDKITDAIEKVAKENGYTYVLELETTLYAGGTDLTKQVRVSLGLPEVAVKKTAALPGTELSMPK